jgi:hypothetical protein
VRFGRGVVVRAGRFHDPKLVGRGELPRPSISPLAEVASAVVMDLNTCAAGAALGHPQPREIVRC